MNRRRLLALLAATLLLQPALAAAAEPKPIKLGAIVPSGSVWDKELKTLAAEAQKRTQGRVTFRLFLGGTAGDDADIVRKMRNRQLHAATLTVDGLTALDKGFSVFSVPRFFGSFEELFHVTRGLTPTLSERLDQKGYVFLGWGYGGWVYLFSKKPVYTVDDVKKLKLFVWAGGETSMVQWWKNNGFEPVVLPSTEMMTGLQTGMIEALPAPPLAAVALQWYRQAPHMFDLPFGQLIGATVISKKTWQELSPADQAAVRELARQMEQRLEKAIPAQDRQAVEEMQKRGLTVTKPKDAAQTKAWEEAAAQFATSMRGNVPADVFDLARKLRDEKRAKP
jgi:TRAP-type transport system periplasmic protein